MKKNLQKSRIFCQQLLQLFEEFKVHIFNMKRKSIVKFYALIASAILCFVQS
jgi:hypothetical protein